MNEIKFYINDDHTLKGAVEGFASAYGNGANTVIMVAPFLTTHTMYVLYRKPNGIEAERYVMIPTGETEIVDVDGNNEEWNIWRNVVPGAVVNIDSAVAQNLAVGFEDWYFVPEDGFLGIVQFEADLVTTFPSAVEGDFVRVVDTNTDWQYLSSVWTDSLTQLVGDESRERVEMVPVVVDPNIDGGLPTVAPDNTEIIITILNNKLSISDAIATYVARDLETAYSAVVTIALTDKIHIQTATGSKFATMSQVVAGAGGMAQADYDPNLYGDTVEKARNVDDGVRSKSASDIIDGIFPALETESIVVDDGSGNQVTITYTHTNGNNYQVLNATYPDGRVAQFNEENYRNYRNETAQVLQSGHFLMTNGASLGNQAVKGILFDEDSPYAYNALGVVTVDDIAINAKSKATCMGIVSRIDIADLFVSGTSYAEGDTVYGRQGTLSNVAPDKPSLQVRAGIIINKVADVVDILICISIFQKVSDSSDVILTNPIEGDLIVRDSNGIFINRNIDTVEFVKTGWDLDIKALVSLSFVDVTRTFTVAKTSANVPYWLSNVKHELDADKTVVIDDVEGLWFIYINPSNVLVASQTAWDLRADDAVPVSVVNWDATNKEAVAVAYELHSWRMSGVDHFDSHFGLGTVHISGGGLSDSGSDTLNITPYTIADEDIIVTIVDDDTPTAYFEQPLTPLQSYKYYRDGANGDLRRADDSTIPFLVVGNKVQLNPFTGGVWTLTDMTINKFGAYWNIWTTDISNPVKMFLGQEESDSLNNAIEDNTLSSLDLGSIPFEEIKVAYRIIVQQINTAPYYVIEQIDNMLVDPITGIPTLTPSSHGALDGLADDDHPQYHNNARGDLRYEPINTMIPKNYEAFTALTSGGVATTDIIIVRDISTGETKKMTTNEFKSWLALTGDIFDPTVNYASEGLGAYKSAMLSYHTLTLDTLGKYKTTIKTQETDQILYIQMPTISSNVNTLQISTDDGVTYYDVLVNGNTIYAELVSEMLLKLQFDGTNFIIDLTTLSQQLTFDSGINSTFGTVAPIKGLSQFNRLYGLALNQVVLDGNGDSLSNFIVVNATLDSSLKLIDTNSFLLNPSATVENLYQDIGVQPEVYVSVWIYKTSGTEFKIQLQRVGAVGVADDLVSTSEFNAQAVDTWVQYSGIYSADIDRIFIGRGNVQTFVVNVDKVEIIPITNTPIASKTATQINGIVQSYIEGYTYIQNFELQSIGEQLFNANETPILGYTDAGTGDIVLASGYKTYEVDLKLSGDYYLSGITTGKVRLRYFLGGSYIGLQDITSSALLTTSADMVRLEYSTTGFDNIPTTMLNEGTTAEDWVKFNSPQDNFKLTNIDGSTLDMLSVGTSVRDEAYPLNGAWYKKPFVKNDYVVSSLTGVADGTNVTRAFISAFTDNVAWITDDTDLTVIGTNGVELQRTISGSFDNATEIGKFYVASNQFLYFIVALGTSQVDAETLLAGTKVYYAQSDHTLIEIEKNGSLIQESNTTFVQLNNFATEYDITFALDSNKQLEILTDKVIYLQGENDNLEIEIEALQSDVLILEADILTKQAKPTLIYGTQINVEIVTSGAVPTTIGDMTAYDVIELHCSLDTPSEPTNFIYRFRYAADFDIWPQWVLTKTATYKDEISFKFEYFTDTKINAYFAELIRTTYSPTSATIVQSTNSLLNIDKIYGYNLS